MDLVSVTAPNSVSLTSFPLVKIWSAFLHSTQDYNRHTLPRVLKQFLTPCPYKRRWGLTLWSHPGLVLVWLQASWGPIWASNHLCASYWKEVLQESVQSWLWSSSTTLPYLWLDTCNWVVKIAAATAVWSCIHCYHYQSEQTRSGKLQYTVSASLAESNSRMRISITLT